LVTQVPIVRNLVYALTRDLARRGRRALNATALEGGAKMAAKSRKINIIIKK
jgi:hypothetical protein